jgi:ankyrin repeat protein
MIAFVSEQPIKDDDGRTPLSFAAMNGRLEAVRLLLNRGAAVDTGRVSCTVEF